MSRNLGFAVKRGFDCAGAALGLITLAPLMAVIAAVTRLRSGGPVVIRQDRVSLNGRHFQLFKFRTLPVSNLEVSDSQWTPPPTDAWGEFLRRTFLDELPQLLNVLRGEMSLVGPRPERPHFVEQFRRQLPDYPRRHSVRGGMTGWAQVKGWRGDTSIRARLEHDLYYVNHWSLMFDLRILLKTLGLLIKEIFRVSAYTPAAEAIAGKGNNARTV